MVLSCVVILLASTCWAQVAVASQATLLQFSWSYPLTCLLHSLLYVNTAGLWGEP